MSASPEILFNPEEYIIRGDVRLCDNQWVIIAAALDLAADVMADHGQCVECRRFPQEYLCPRHESDMAQSKIFARALDELKLLAKASRLAGKS